MSAVNEDSARYQITAEGLAALERELNELETEGRAEMADRIKTARAFGDLKENSEYHDAKNDQAHLETKILLLRDRARNAVVVKSAVGSGRIALGSAVTVHDEESGTETRYELVSANEADLKQGRLSFESPLARALTGASIDDVVEFQAPRGTRRLRILSIG
jgi:transcription elongation factor GreA